MNACLMLLVLLLPAQAKSEEDQEKKRDAIIDRFILADTGRLAGAEAKKAIAEFDKLGVEAVPALIRGLNRSAKLDHTCPVLMISKKLGKILLACDDEKLIEFARDEIGAGLSKTPHAGTLADLRVRLAMHQNALARRPPIPAGGPGKMTTTALMRAIPRVRGEQLQSVLRELGQRDEREALIGLTSATNHRDPTIAQLARQMLDEHQSRLSISMLEERMKEGASEVKRSAIRVARDKHLELTLAIIDRLTDEQPAVRAEARAALKKLSEGKQDFGPEPNANKEKQREAQRRWREWWLSHADK